MIEEKTITFSANQQNLIKTGGISHYASDTICYIKAIFELGENWTDFDEIRAMFKTPYDCRPAVLNSLGECIVPREILMHKAEVRVNLVGSDYTEEAVIDRLTTYSCEALVVDEDVPVSGIESTPLSPSEYEQFVANVKADANRAEASATSAETYADNSLASAQASEASALRSANSATDSATSASQAENYATSAEQSANSAESSADEAEQAKDTILGMRAEATTLPSGSQATASYSDGVMSFGIPKGDKGNKGDAGDSAGFGSVTASVDDNTGTPSVDVTTSGTDQAKNFAFAFHNLKGAKGDKGDTGEVSQAELDEAVTDLKSDISDNYDGLMTGEMGLFEISNPKNWEQNSINGTTGMDETVAQYARVKITKAFYAYYDITIQSLGTGCYFYFYKYSDKACTQSLGELPQILNYQGVTEVTLPKGYWYRIKGIIIPTVTMTPEKIAELCAKFSASGTNKIKDNSDAISELDNRLDTAETNITTNRSAFDNLFYLVYGKNRNPDNDSEGYLNSSGELVVAGGWVSTDFCYVGDLSVINASGSIVGGSGRGQISLHFLCSYNANKELIEQVYTTGQNTYTVGENVAYIRFSYKPTSYDDVMVEGGTTFSNDFIPYTEQLKLKNEYYNSGTNWSGKKWAAVGDSLTEVNNRTLKNYHAFVADVTGINVVNMGASGTGYKNTENENKAFYQRISSVPLDTDVVTIFGSGNDMQYVNSALGTATDSGTSTLCGCINTTIDNLYAVLPTVQLGIVTPCPWISYPPSVSDNLMERYSAKIVEICKLRGIPCLDLYHCSGLRPWEASYREIVYSRDGGDGGVHPNEIGHEILAPHFKAFLSTLIL